MSKFKIFNEKHLAWSEIASKLDIDDSIDDEKVIVFNVNGYVTNGIQDSHIVLPFDCKIKSVSVSVLESSTSDIDINIQRSSDYVTWTNIFTNPVTLQAETNTYETTPNIEITLIKGTVLRMNIPSSNNDGRNLSFNLVVTKQ